jgi:hypothetical protein
MTGSDAKTYMQGFDFSNVWKTQAGSYPILTRVSLNNTDPTKPVRLQVSNVPDAVQSGSSFSVSYTLENNGQAATAYTLSSTTNTSNVTVTDFTGDIWSKTPKADPPSASTDSLSVGQIGSLTIEYQVSSNFTGAVQLDTSASAPLSGDSDSKSTTVTITNQTTPTDPTQRVLQVTGKQSASQLTQSDVTTFITLKSRESMRNGVKSHKMM